MCRSDRPSCLNKGVPFLLTMTMSLSASCDVEAYAVKACGVSLYCILPSFEYRFRKISALCHEVSSAIIATKQLSTSFDYRQWVFSSAVLRINMGYVRIMHATSQKKIDGSDIKISMSQQRTMNCNRTVRLILILQWSCYYYTEVRKLVYVFFDLFTCSRQKDSRIIFCAQTHLSKELLRYFLLANIWNYINGIWCRINKKNSKKSSLFQLYALNNNLLHWMENNAWCTHKKLIKIGLCKQ